MDDRLAYDPDRIRSLSQRTVAAIEWLDGRSSDEPMARDALATLRGISHTLGTTWIPYLSQLLGDTSMISWDHSGPGVPALPARGFGGAGTVDGQEPPSPGPMTMVELLSYLQHFTGEWDMSWFDPNVMEADPVGGFLDSESEFAKWFGVVQREHRFGADDHWAQEGFTATYDGNASTLDLSLESDIEFADGVDADGVVVTVLGVAGDASPEFESGEPGTSESVAVNLDVALGGAAVCSPFGPAGSVACGALTGLAGIPLTASEPGRADVECWVLATPVDHHGTIVGPPVVVRAVVGIELSPEEQFELIEEAVDQGQEAEPETVVANGEELEVLPPGATLVNVLPANGDTFIVMEDVDDVGGF